MQQKFRFTGESVVEIEARSSLHPIGGQTHQVQGEAAVEVADGQIQLQPQPSGYIEVPVEALESGHKLQDREMRRRVDAKRYPIIRYDLTEVSGGPDRYTLAGALTFHGVRQPFNEEVTARIVDGQLVVEGEHTFNIEQFGVKPPKILTLQVYPDVRIRARLVGTPI